VFAADTLLYAVNLTFDPVTLTFDLEHVQCIACDVMKLCTKFERNRAIHGRVIAISVFDLMTFNIVLHVALSSGSWSFVTLLQQISELTINELNSVVTDSEFASESANFSPVR